MGKLILVMLQQTFVERQGRRRRIEGGAIFFLYIYIQSIYILDILFSSNQNIHKSLSGLCIWASDHLINGF